MTANVRSLGWLGTGRMGAALAGRLIEAGERVTVWNRTAAKTAPLVSAGARAVGADRRAGFVRHRVRDGVFLARTWRRWSWRCSAGRRGRR